MNKKDADQWQEILAAAREIDNKYQEMDQERLGRIWTNTEFLAACSTDWGELVEGIMKLEGLRSGDADKDAVRHELADMLWALIVLSDRLDIDLASSFLETMSELKKHFT